MTPDEPPLTLRHLLTRAFPPRPWRDGHKIPWHDPRFSERVLPVHLDPDTHMASRAPDVIRAHVDWLFELLSAEEPGPAGRPRHLLDLGCGPGLYALALARAGLQVTGIDYGPAAVAHARAEAAREGLDDRVSIVEADLTALGADLRARLAPVDVATFWFAEIASFTPDEARGLMGDLAAMVRPGGLVVIEWMPEELFARHAETSWETRDRSVFSDRPHLWLQEHHWDDDQRAEITVHWIVDLETGRVERHAQCHQAYAREEIDVLLTDAGFERPTHHPPITGVDEQMEFPVLVTRRGEG
ncbi:methyltransferase domain-containing protein [bacterium]|nr:methyltransferase domain-containing protein [bacterium]